MRQVRLQSATVDNVVSYTAVVSVQNTDGRLRPGMTARVEVQVEERHNALSVPLEAVFLKYAVPVVYAVVSAGLAAWFPSTTSVSAIPTRKSRCWTASG